MSGPAYGQRLRDFPGLETLTTRLSATPQFRDLSDAEEKYLVDSWLDLSKSMSHGSIAVSTLIAGFTFNTMLGQSFQPRYVFDESEVQLLLALTFLFSTFAILLAGYVLWISKFITHRIKFSTDRGNKELAPALRSALKMLASAFATLTVNSASFVTLSLAIMAFQKAVGAFIVAVTSFVTLNLILYTLYSAV
jgi:hypothetical protein